MTEARLIRSNERNCGRGFCGGVNLGESFLIVYAPVRGAHQTIIPFFSAHTQWMKRDLANPGERCAKLFS